MAGRNSRNNGLKTGRRKPPVEHQFKLGNPGRPKGSRNKMSEAFIQALHADFLEHGPATLAAVRETKPLAYLRVLVSLLPKEMKVKTASDLTDGQLIGRIRQLNHELAQAGVELWDDEAEDQPASAHAPAH